MNYNILVLVGIIVSAGFLGGVANYYMEQANGAGFRKSVFLGLTASATVPLFLKTVSSSLMDDCLKGEAVPFFVFFGFCTVAAIFSSKFLQSLADKLLQEVNEVKQKQEELSETTEVLVAQNSDPVPGSSSPLPSLPATGDDDALESFKGAQRAEPPMSDEQKVLSMLRGKFAFRTAEGIAQDTGMDLSSVQTKLLEMETQGKVRKTKRARDGAMVWCLK